MKDIYKFDDKLDGELLDQGRFWTAWSDFYGFPDHEHNPYGPDAYDRFCTIANTENDKLESTRFRECTL